ncbi:MAG TPA: HAD family phosphatase [Verrucomicrobiae bacterium]|nr:HAD family phosphatase [Verrucomicrobiae bacterium]
MIKGIIFDCYGVLVHGSLDYLRSLTSENDRQAFNELSHASDRGYISRTDYILGVGKLINRTPEDIEQIIARQEIRSPEMLEFVISLRANYKTAMLSNVGRGSVERLFGEEELKNLFEVVVLSSEVGVTKPGVAIYQLTASRLGLLPEECLMIDDIAVNVEGAKAAGMQAVQFKDIQQCKQEVMVAVKGVYA